MALIKSISGIRGTIGGKAGEGLSPLDVVRYTAAYGEWILRGFDNRKARIVIGMDARPSGEMIKKIVSATLNAMGIDVLDLGLATTPTVEIAVTSEKAAGGIILTASHNPVQWNALKLLNADGEFVSSGDGAKILEIAEKMDYSFASWDMLGKLEINNSYNKRHIDMLMAMEDINLEKIRERKFTVVIDCVNSVGGLILPELLRRLGVKEIIEIFTEPTGIFPHNPEPLPENLGELRQAVVDNKADLGFVVDPDVDRLAIVSEDGSCFNEEYTLVACADYILSRRRGNTVSNMSSSRALRDITEKHGGEWYASAVGEVNVVEKMKQVDAVIGGEGNGGVIYPPLHHGRDALAGIALFLSLLAERGLSCSQLRATYPEYVISKNRIELSQDSDADAIIRKIHEELRHKLVSTEDGLLLEDEQGWINIRKSNTEPILRVYSEGRTREDADSQAEEIIKFVKKIS
ncbi:MAG: phosphoglucosamine mutase [Bacteroidales bacterium]|jgi:phosphomannomutase|nr:phosphoglucosamine mutase [Bacteroidales bacterium]